MLIAPTQRAPLQGWFEPAPLDVERSPCRQSSFSVVGSAWI